MLKSYFDVPLNNNNIILIKLSSLSKLLTIDGLEKQIYIGTDIPIQAGNLSYSLQPLIFDIVEDLQYLLEG